MNAHAPIVAPETIQLAATNADILRTILQGSPNGEGLKAPGDIAHACGRDTKNIGRQIKLLTDAGLIVRDDVFALTPAGELAVRGIDMAQGLAGDAVADPSALNLLHHHIRPNPHQPRQHFPRVELDGLKATVVAAGGVLQPLLVYPPDADGVHDLADGERRWRVVGELIEEGVWPRDRSLRAIQRERTPGDAAFVGLITAQQGQKLPKMDQARAYRTLCEERSWSARKAALETGEHPKNVQEMLQVLAKGDADDIAAFEAGRDGWTWERLRDSVKEHREPEAGEAAQQLDVEDVAADPAKAEWYAGRRERVHEGCGRATARHIAVLVEVADKALRNPAKARAYGQHYATVGETYPDPTHASQWLIENVGLGFSYGGGEKACATILDDVIDWLRSQGLLTTEGDRDAILLQARTAGFGAAKATAAAKSASYVTAWLDPTWTGSQAADKLAQAPSAAAKPVRQPAGVDLVLHAVERVTMAELMFRLREAPDATHPAEQTPLVRAPKYWLDGSVAKLKDAGFVAPIHNVEPGGPYMAMLAPGVAWLDHNIPELTADALERERQALPNPHARGEDGYVTPWLNGAAQASAIFEPARSLAPSDDGPDNDPEAAGLLALVRATLSKSHTAADVRELLARTGLQRPFGTSDKPEESGVVFDQDGDEAAVADTSGEIHNALAEARAELIAYALNLATGGDAQRPGPAVVHAPLFQFAAGDLVSIGGEASGYRLIQLDREAGQSGPSFLAQQVSLKTGKDMGKPRGVTLHAIQRVIRRAVAVGEG